MLSGWGRAASAANTEAKLTDTTAENNTETRYFGLIARVDYTDDTKEYFYMPFNDDYDKWQYASCIITPKKANQTKTIESITVITAYDFNVNTALFDNLSLTREPCSTYTYDDDGNLTAVNATGNSQQSFTYAAGTSDLTESNTESNGTYKYTYNDNHLVTKIENDGVFMDITYDDYGNSIGTTLSADGNETIGEIKTSATYSTDGSQLMTQTSATGNVTTYGYNSKRQLISTDNSDTEGVGAKVENTYYSNTDRVKQTYISNVVSTQNYYTNGLLTQIERGGYLPDAEIKPENKKNQAYNMAYDGFGNMTSIAVGSRTLASYTYGANNGNLQSMTYGNGHVVSYAYDNLDRVTHEYWNNTLKYQYFYNSEGELSKKLDVSTNKAVNYEYDSLGRLIYSWQTSGNEIVQKTEHLYDTENRITTQGWQFRNSDGTYTTTTETYVYNTDGSVYTVTPSSGGQYAFEYDDLKRQSGRYNWYYKTNYSYADGKNEGETTTQVSQIFYEHRDGGASFDEFTVDYTYDALGNITSITSTEWPDLNTTYKYDAQGQLIEETNRNNTFYYTYDTYGNIRTAQKKDSTSSTVFSYDNEEWRDLLTAYKGVAISYDAIGNPTNWKNNTTWTSLTWQNGRQLASIVSSSKTLNFTYDLAGIRDSKTVTTSSGTVTYNYVTQNGQVVRQTWNDGTTSHVMDFIYDNQGRPYAADYDGTRYYYVLSLQGDVLRMVDTTGTTVASYVYDSWGRLLTSSGTLKDVNPLRYRGYYYDAETKLYYLGSRYYDPLVKRFINSDTSDLVIANPNSLNDKNLFAYCNNSPVIQADDRGMLGHIAIGAIVGGIAGAVGQMLSDVVTSTLNGQITISNWQTYTGAIVGGAAGGAVLAASGNMNAANAVTGAVTTGVGQVLEKVTIKNYNKSWKEIAVNTVADGAISYGLGKLPGIKGATAGRNSWSAVYKSGLTKLRNRTVSRMSVKVFAKGIGSSISGGLYLDGYYGTKQHAYDRVKKLFLK